jgi:hypothetical protein
MFSELKRSVIFVAAKEEKKKKKVVSGPVFYGTQRYNWRSINYKHPPKANIRSLNSSS